MLTDPVPPSWPAISCHVHVYVPDVDVTYKKALAAGAVSVQKPIKRQDENKRASVKDAGGNKLVDCHESRINFIHAHSVFNQWRPNQQLKLNG